MPAAMPLEEVINIGGVVRVRAHEGLARQVVPGIACGQVADTHEEPGEAMRLRPQRLQRLLALKELLARCERTAVVAGGELADCHVVENLALEAVKALRRCNLRRETLPLLPRNRGGAGALPAAVADAAPRSLGFRLPGKRKRRAAGGRGGRGGRGGARREAMRQLLVLRRRAGRCELPHELQCQAEVLNGSLRVPQVERAHGTVEHELVRQEQRSPGGPPRE